jgi:hypothetical protein
MVTDDLLTTRAVATLGRFAARPLPQSGVYGKDMLTRLERRAQYLVARITSAPPGAELSYDRAELSALVWAYRHIHELEAAACRGVLDNGHRKPPESI